MLKFKFFVHCDGWAKGGYENIHFAETEKEARKRIADWNKYYEKHNSNCFVELLSVTEISNAEFVEDYIH